MTVYQCVSNYNLLSVGAGVLMNYCMLATGKH